MWKHMCDNANVRIWWIGYIYMVMWNVHAVKWRHRFENEKNIDSVIRMPDFVMQICVIGNVRIRARWIGPYAWRSVRTPFRRCTLSVLQNVLWVFRRCLWIFHGVFVGVLQSVRHVIGRPSAAVGADLSRPHIGKYTRNGGQICVFGNVEMHFW